MANQVLRDRYGNKLGEIVQESGKLVLRDRYGNKKGFYDPSTDTTRDTYGNKVGSGNILATLL
jgi:hypothetical protein